MPIFRWLLAADKADASVIPLDEVKPSQSGSVSQTIANTELTITCDRPVARGLELFGGIIPYGEIWNSGANDATAITLSRAVTINGNLSKRASAASGPFQANANGRSFSAVPPMSFTNPILVKSAMRCA